MRRGLVVIGCVVLLACGDQRQQSSVVSREDSRQSSVVSRQAVDSGSFPETPFGLGRAPSKAELKAWSISVNPAGSNLPPGKGSFTSGEKVFAAKCASCHGAQGEGIPPTYPKLVQAEPKDFSFDTDYKIPHTVGNYWPYATTLYDYINRSMPLTEPGSLTPDEVYGVVAYLLAANGVIAKDAVMDARTLPKVEMPSRDHFVNDDRSGGAEFR